MPRLFHKQNDGRDFLEVNHFRPAALTETVVVYLHGFASVQTGEKALYFRDRLLARGYAYFTLDFRGHGQSSGSMRELTATRLLEDCELVVDHLRSQYKNIVLIGSSLGGWTACWHAARHPNQIAANILIAPGFGFPATILRSLTPAELKRWKEDGTIAFRNEYCNVELGYSLIQDASNYLLASLKASYRTPSLIIHGMQDEIVDYRQSLDFIQECEFPQLELVLIKSGDHRLTDQKERLADLIENYINQSRSLCKPL